MAIQTLTRLFDHPLLLHPPERRFKHTKIVPLVRRCDTIFFTEFRPFDFCSPLVAAAFVAASRASGEASHRGLPITVLTHLKVLNFWTRKSLQNLFLSAQRYLPCSLRSKMWPGSFYGVEEVTADVKSNHTCSHVAPVFNMCSVNTFRTMRYL